MNFLLFSQRKQFPVDETPLTVSGLNPGHLYEVVLKAKGARGQSQPSQKVEFYANVGAEATSHKSKPNCARFGIIRFATLYLRSG